MSDIGTEWAAYEVEMVMNGCTDNVVRAVYNSAVEAYRALWESPDFTEAAHVLDLLVRRIPLTPILDAPEQWNEAFGFDDKSCESFQHKRRSSLFKDVYSNGKIEYKDVDYCVCVDIHNMHVKYHSGLVSDLIHKLFPITMPYLPLEKPIEVHCEDFLVDEKNGDFDTVGVFEAVFPDGKSFNINKFYKEVDGKFKEISMTEYYNRKNSQVRPSY